MKHATRSEAFIQLVAEHVLHQVLYFLQNVCYSFQKLKNVF